ncbi:response regulator [Lactiplantibacillus plantarum]|uniref:hypothetical protein n=1 Tax=Lactiplantibacillus plantarum TaxID=1590 RepID=UPI000CAC9517|nr:hypothetical protein [Lactiplantibacillus plantarum]PME01910.1 hypothetical protein S101520_01745 [Lactiplantibacillus plantarum subsp. plantarum]
MLSNLFYLEDNETQRVEYKSIIKNIIMIKEYDMQLVVATGDLHELMNNIVNSKEGLFFLGYGNWGQTQAGLNLAD